MVGRVHPRAMSGISPPSWRQKRARHVLMIDVWSKSSCETPGAHAGRDDDSRHPLSIGSKLRPRIVVLGAGRLNVVEEAAVLVVRDVSAPTRGCERAR
jgi:hypothetical protein